MADRIDNRGGLLNVAIGFVGAAGSVGMTLATGSATTYLISAFMILGFVVAVASFLHMLLRERELIEERELEEIRQEGASEALFEEGEVLPAKRSREQFEKWGMPLVTMVMLSFQIYGVYYMAVKFLPPAFETIDSWEVHNKPIAVSCAALLGMIFFIRGQFASNLARIEQQRFLQPASEYILFGGYLNFVLCVVVAIAFKNAGADVYVGSALTVLLAFATVENLFSMIFEVYRPRAEGRQSRLLYQSRLMGLIAKPENLFTSAGQILDYQFGFKVSQTSGYQFLRDRLGVLIAMQIVLLWLSTSIVVIEPSGRGKLMDVMQKNARLLEPGIHLKLPWPFAAVERFYPDQVHTFHVGLVPLDEDERPADHPGLWLEPTGKDYDSQRRTGELFFLTGSGKKDIQANLMVASVPVQYRIRSEGSGNIKGLEEGWLRYSDPEGLLQNIANREVTHYFLKHDFGDLLIRGRKVAQDSLKKNIQDKANALGVEILFVGLSDLRPPAESPLRVVDRTEEQSEGIEYSPIQVASVFENPVNVNLRSQLDQFLANQEQNRFKSEETNGVEFLKYTAKMASALKRMQAKARADRQIGVKKPFEQAPTVYPLWLYLTTFERAVSPARKYVIAAENYDIEVDIDLHEAIRRGMTDIKIKPEDKK